MPLLIHTVCHRLWQVAPDDMHVVVQEHHITQPGVEGGEEGTWLSICLINWVERVKTSSGSVVNNGCFMLSIEKNFAHL